MVVWCVWWIVFGLLTWVSELIILGLITLSKFDRSVYHEIGSKWIDKYFESMVPVFMRKSAVLGNLWTSLCVLVTWPFDRVVMYIHWKETCKHFSVEREGS